MSAGFWQHLPPRERAAKARAHRQQTAIQVWGCGCPVCTVADSEAETCRAKPGSDETPAG